MKNYLLFAVMIFVAFACRKNDQDSNLSVQFTSNKNVVGLGGSVSFTDLSEGGPAEWKWTFDMGNPSTSTEKNPTVTYTSEGIYNVTLHIKRGDAEAERTILQCIKVVAPVDRAKTNLIGTWKRVESNNSSLDGMQVVVDNANAEGIIVNTPNTSFPVNGLKWKNIDSVGSYEYEVDDLDAQGNYIAMSLFILSHGNQLIIGNFKNSGAGSMQRWERVDNRYAESEISSISGMWYRTKSNNSQLDGMKVLVDNAQTSGKIVTSPNSAFPIDSYKWKDIVNQEDYSFKFQDLTSDGGYADSKMYMTGSGKTIILGSFSSRTGSFQKWTKQ